MATATPARLDAMAALGDREVAHLHHSSVLEDTFRGRVAVERFVAAVHAGDAEPSDVIALLDQHLTAGGLRNLRLRGAVQALTDAATAPRPVPAIVFATTEGAD